MISGDRSDQAAAGGRLAFILGPGRSGTTLLYKLLCLHPEVAYVSNLQHKLGWLPPALTARLHPVHEARKLRHWFQQGGNAYFVHRPLARRLVPAPVEGENLYARCGIPLFPAKDYRPDPEAGARLGACFEDIRRASGARVLVTKRTANNRRIGALHALFPRARYINLLRDGRDVAASLERVEWWNDHRLWWDEQHRTPAQLAASGVEMLSLCARNWVAEMDAIRDGLATVPEEQVLNVRFEALLTAPLPELRRIQRFLDLPASAKCDAALESLDLSYRPGAWRSRWTSSQLGLVQSIQHAYLNKLGYSG